MTTNQTIDGVPRELLQKIADGGYCHQGLMDKLRALLDADKVNKRQMGLMQFVEAHPIKPTGLSQGWNLTRKHDGFVVGHQSVAYSPDEKAIERAERDGYVWVPFLVPAAQPKCSACNDTGRMHEPGCEPGACTACLENTAAQP